jgi:AcrR family transcriptional regulator
MAQPESSAGDTPARDPRREILAAASSLLYEGGAEGLTIRRLALRCGYTAPAIYHIFGDKAGLLDAIMREAIDALIERIEQVPDHPDPKERLRMQFREIVRFGREHPTNYPADRGAAPRQVLAAEHRQSSGARSKRLARRSSTWCARATSNLDPRSPPGVLGAACTA